MSEEVIMINEDNYPLIFARRDTRFWEDMNQPMSINMAQTNRAHFMLICTERDLKLWCNIGMKPHRSWKVSDVKKYFGLTGSKQTLLPRFLALKEEYERLLQDIRSLNN
tara:strand:- start:96 stop:422 length:327 start_codon:yes stop_codon:yes gene_type:complete